MSLFTWVVVWFSGSLFVCPEEWYTFKNMQGIFLKGSSLYQPTSSQWKVFQILNDVRADLTVYRSIISSLLYLIATRPDLMFTTSLLLRFMIDHFCVAKRTLIYIKGTIDYGIWFKKEEQGKLMGYSGSDWKESLIMFFCKGERSGCSIFCESTTYSCC